MQDNALQRIPPADSSPVTVKRSRFWTKLFIVAGALVATAIVLWATPGGSGFLHRKTGHPANLSQWMNDHPAADQIVFFHDKSEFFGGVCTPEATALMKTSQFDWNRSMVLCRDHGDLDSYLASVGAKRNVYQGSRDEDPDAVVFRGDRGCPAGERFVLVTAADSGKWLPNGATKAFNFMTDVFSTGGGKSPLSNLSTEPADSQIGFFRHQVGDVVRIFAGQADPADPSHFTVAYSINAKQGLIDGNLQPDGKTVVFSLRQGGPLRIFPDQAKPDNKPWPFVPRLSAESVIKEQAKWMTYQAPTDQLVLLQDKVTFVDGDLRFDEAAESNSLLEKNPDFTVSYASGNAHWIVGRTNAALDNFLKGAGTYRTLPAHMPNQGPLLYCGGRTSAAGDRLVAISFYCKLFYDNDPEHNESFGIFCDVFSPATATAALQKVSSVPDAARSAAITNVPQGPEARVGYYRHKNDVIRFFAGQNDAADPSHFTIRYIMNGTESFIDGNLQADGKTVNLAVRGGGPLVEAK